MSPTQLALALVTDLSNLKSYEAMPSVLAPLVLVAEERLAVLQAHLATVRIAAGMPRNGAILQG